MARAQRSRVFLVVLALLSLALLGCGAAEQPLAAPPASQQTPAPTAAPTATPTPTPTPSPTPAPRSNTSGRVLTGSENYRPVIISIENSKGARPQTGLMNADIVYESLVEASITRFQTLFSDDVPVIVGPVRSTRYYFLDLLTEWNCLYGFLGYHTLPGEYRRKLKDYPNAVAGHSGQFHYVHTKGVGRVHSLHVDLQDFLAEEYGDIVPERTDARFLFGGNVTYATGNPAVAQVEIPFTSSALVTYVYDAAANKFLRYQDGAQFMTRMPDAAGDRSTIVPVQVQNLILQLVPVGKIPNVGKGRRSVDLFGTGECAFFVNGQYLAGTWTRQSQEDVTHYRLSDGTELTLEEGNTWIAFVPADAPWRFFYEGDPAIVPPKGMAADSASPSADPAETPDAGESPAPEEDAD